MKDTNTLRVAAATLLLIAGIAFPLGANAFDPVISLPGETRILVDGDFEMLVTAKQTGGELGMVVISNAPDGGHPINTHTTETETFYVLEGQYRFFVGDETFDGGPGTTVVNPANVPHTFKNIGTTPGRLLAVYTPGGFEEFFLEWDATGITRGPALGALEKKHGIVPAE